VYEKTNEWRFGPKKEEKKTKKQSKVYTEPPPLEYDPANTKWIYLFKEGRKELRRELGGKGANLCEMTNLGIRIPPGFTISTYVCDYYNRNNGAFPAGLMESIFNNKQQDGALKYIESELSNGSSFGDDSNPLLLSVRSGAAISMPGMMDTVLNLGLNDKSVESLAKLTNNKRFAYDSYRRLIQMFGNVVMEFDISYFEKELERIKKQNNYQYDTQLTVKDLQQLITAYKRVYKKLHPQHRDFPQDPNEQLKMAIEAVFKSWDTPRAVAYRNINHLNNKGLMGTAVNVQAMVFGNKGETSGTGVCFTRDPSNGRKRFYGEFLMNAQGEDVVSGMRTPLSIDELAKVMPAVYDELVQIYQKLELHYKDMQDMEFTIQDGKLFILQTRNGKRTVRAAVKMAVDMVHEGLIDKETALLRINADQIEQLLHQQFDEAVLKKSHSMGTGLPASPGVAVGKIVFDAARALQMHNSGERVILVRNETSPEDIIGMNVAEGILTIHGGMTSHAAVIARGMGTCCVAGCSDGSIHEEGPLTTLRFATEEDGSVISLREGDVISLDGTRGKVYEGALPVIDVDLQQLMKQSEFGELLEWAKQVKSLGVRSNADNPHDAQNALDLGSEGIGLCRTEHMFFSKSRIKLMREMILLEEGEHAAGSHNAQRIEEILDKLKSYQKADFAAIYRVMKTKDVTIRLLDPPLHEFLPHDMPLKEKRVICRELGLSMHELDAKIAELKETNPMLGHRGCRLGITHPDITRMQVGAIMEAAIEVSNELGMLITPEIMVPLVGHIRELQLQKEAICEVADEVIARSNLRSRMRYRVGTMIEVPRAALTADEIAPHVDFFSFGTNDLTQMTCGFSRDDAQSSFLADYVDKFAIYSYDPFQVLDDDGVGRLMQIAVNAGKQSNPSLTVGICGEHGGNPHSIRFCNANSFNYVSCSPFRVPVAILAAAQARLTQEKNEKNQENEKEKEDETK